jgi:hypothetical protein
MSLTWITPRADIWHTKSADGYYGIHEHLRTSEYEAFFIEAVFAIPKPIGTRGSLEDAKKICEEHRAAQIAA